MLAGSENALAQTAGVDTDAALRGLPESTWIEVIRKMESVYSDLVNSQVEVEQKNAALEDAQRFIRSVLRAMTDVLIVCDMRGRIEKVNDALQRLSGQAETDLLGTAVTALFTPESRAKIESGISSQEANSCHDDEVAMIAADGDGYLLSVNCTNRYDADGKLVGKVLIGRSIGELHRAYQKLNEAHRTLQQAQAQLVQSEKMASLGRLVAGVAHELNNPISFVFGNMTALRAYEQRISQFLDDVEQGLPREALRARREELKIDRIMSDMDSLIEGSLEGAERVRDIVQSLRRYSTPQKEAVAEFDLADAIQTAVRWVSRGTRRVFKIYYDLPGQLAVSGHKGTVHQILMNLVQNAVDVMEDDDAPRIDIGCEIAGDDAVIRVRDHGPGIPEDALPKLFEPFYTTKPVGKGTGLGLSISYGLAVNQGGDLTAENHPSGGAVFTLRLPLEFRDAGD